MPRPAICQPEDNCPAASQDDSAAHGIRVQHPDLHDHDDETEATRIRPQCPSGSIRAGRDLHDPLVVRARARAWCGPDGFVGERAREKDRRRREIEGDKLRKEKKMCVREPDENVRPRLLAIIPYWGVPRGRAGYYVTVFDARTRRVSNRDR